MTDKPQTTPGGREIKDVSHALMVIKYMGEQRARFILATLVASEAATLDTFRSAYQMSFVQRDI